MSKHTPGPWKISETENYAEIYGAIPNLPAIALVQSSHEDIRLIAAAPEMLVMLKRIYEAPILPMNVSAEEMKLLTVDLPALIQKVEPEN